ncbi:DMT family transporter [Pelagibacterium xiamenense]|uniref:DMT family transporter n=1 Tax=Pelagibacterium xiamenense TaxID=2901140 RepID=UPI001E432316|nr:DMT family transporter [Pelagibacterium xiamenense]MCD7061249.1 DMT family transporter [Pelagibacterium xiamenense]
MSDAADRTIATPRMDTLGYGLAIAGAALFSTKGIFIKLAYASGIGPETVLALRMIVALPVYVFIAVLILLREPSLRAKLSARATIAAISIGILGYYVASSFDFWGLSFVTAQYERLVLFTYPFFTLALGVMFFGDTMNWRTVPGLLTSYAGLLVIFGWNLATNPNGLLEGTVLVLLSGLTFALYQHLAKKSMNRIGARLFTCIGMSAAGVVAIAHNTIQHGATSYAGLSSEVWFYGLCLGILGTVLPSFLLNTAISRIGARATSSTGPFGPVVTIVLAVLILGEPFTQYHAIGTMLVILGVLWFSRAERNGKRQLVAA